MKVWLEAWLSEYGKAWCSMKIEKVNDNQIRCTLTREDLAERQIKLSELAYGTEKAKLLFRDMMQQAAYEFGFEADDIPLMIEAIPLSQDTIILVITKVEYPEELDTRFSKFSDPDSEDVYEEAMAGGGAAPAPEGADDILGLFRRIQVIFLRSPDWRTRCRASIRGITICIRMRRHTGIIFWSARADRRRKSSTRCATFYPNTERSRRIRRQQARS